MYESHKIKLTSSGKKFWGTKKNHLTIIVIDKPVEMNAGYWDGGSRDEYSGKTKSGGVVALSYPTSPREYGGGEPTSIMPNDNLAVVVGGVFCGNVRGLTVYVNKLDGWIRPTDGAEVQKLVLS
jgi:hypothetical protein